jgi:predicted permease
MSQDLRYALRALVKAPGFTVAAVLTLALGIGANTAMFAVVNAVLLEPLPYAHAHEVGVFWKKTDWTDQEFLHIRGRTPGFQQVALYRHRDVILRDRDAAASLVPGIAASAELFDVLGVSPFLGRGFRAGDDSPGAEPVAVLSFGLWQELGANPSIIGTRVTLDGMPRTVVGVMPSAFWFPDPSVRIWTPVLLNPKSVSWNSTLVGRVDRGVDVRAMAPQVAQLTGMLDERFDYPPQWDKRKNPHITPLRDDLTGTMQPALLATLGAMALILLIACANVSALILGRVHLRSVELAVRSALGADRRRLLQPLAIEALLVAAAAGTSGAVIAARGSSVLTRALPLGAWAEAARADWRLFASAMAIAVAAALVVIIVPAFSLYRRDLRDVLNRARTAGIQGRGGRLENGLVIAEVALAVVIAAGATLLGRSVANLYDVDPGVRTEGIAVVDVVLGSGLNRARLEQTLHELTMALTELPGVRSVGAAQKLPVRGGGYNLGATIDGRPDIDDMTTEYRIVTPGYLESIGIGVREGRTINSADRRDTERVVVINEALAQKYFAGVDPIGKRIGGDGTRTSSRVVGVVSNAAERQLTDAAVPVRYVAVAQMPWVDQIQSLVLRAAPGVDETSLLEPARRTIARAAPGVAVQQTTTMRRVLDTAIGPARQIVVLLSVLSLLALVLGAVGIYGVMAHFAGRRRRDWAIRVALGILPTRVIAYVVGRGALLVAAGVGLGIVAAAILTRVLSSFLYGVSASDPIAFAAAAAALLAVGVGAAFIPAWRAGKTDPTIALRYE